MAKYAVFTDDTYMGTWRADAHAEAIERFVHDAQLSPEDVHKIGDFTATEREDFVVQCRRLLVEGIPSEAIEHDDGGMTYKFESWPAENGFPVGGDWVAIREDKDHRITDAMLVDHLANVVSRIEAGEVVEDDV